MEVGVLAPLSASQRAIEKVWRLESHTEGDIGTPVQFLA